MKSFYTLSFIFIFLSVNAQWSKVPTSFTTGLSIARPSFSVEDTRLVYIDNSYQVHSSSDAGKNWKMVTIPAAQAFKALLTPSKIVLNLTDGVYTSTDKGANFNKMSNAPDVNYFINIGEDIYSVSFNTGVMKYTSSSNSWRNIYKAGITISNIVYANDRIFITYTDATSKKVTETSKDLGVTWNVTNLPNQTFFEFKKSSTTYFASYSNGIYQSTDGINFTFLIGDQFPLDIRDIAIESDTLYASFAGTGFSGASSNGIMFYNKALNTWAKFDQGITYNSSNFNRLIWNNGTMWALQSDNNYSLLKRTVGVKVANHDILAQNNSKLFPNPATNTLNIDFPADSKISNIELYDYQGKLVRIITNDYQNIVVSDLPKGMYVFKIISSGSFFTKSFIKI